VKLDVTCLTVALLVFARSLLTVDTQQSSYMPGDHIELSQLIWLTEALEVQVQLQNFRLQQLLLLQLQQPVLLSVLLIMLVRVVSYMLQYCRECGFDIFSLTTNFIGYPNNQR